MDKPLTGNPAQPQRVPGSTPAAFESLKGQILELRKAGTPFTEISRTVGISVYLIKRALVEMGVQETSRRTAYKLDIPRERVEELLAQGKTRYQLESILGISGRSVLTLLARYGLKASPAQHINLVLAREGQRRCCECGQVKCLATEFYNQKGSSEGKGYRCKACSRNWLKLAQQRASARKDSQLPPASC
jgi:hypothetical protein